jgi:UDP-N-acetylmuramyl pentapeptide synthase
MVRNALLACAAGITHGITLEECVAGLAAPQLSKGRLQQKMIGGITFLDDTYNANPDSVVAALAALGQIPGPARRIAILGAMGELGSQSEYGHRLVGKSAATHTLTHLITVGDKARWIAEEASANGLGATTHAADPEEAAATLKSIAQEGDIVLVKGSRSARMERVIESFKNGGAA